MHRPGGPTARFLGGSLGEGIGWRGFQLPALLWRMSEWSASIVLVSSPVPGERRVAENFHRPARVNWSPHGRTAAAFGVGRDEALLRSVSFLGGDVNDDDSVLHRRHGDRSIH